MQERLEYIDNLKVVAICAVIMLHVACRYCGVYPYISSSGDFLTALFYNSFVRFCVPLFLMVSGATILSKECTPSRMINKVLTRLIPPYILYYFVYVAFETHSFPTPLEPSRVHFHFYFVGVIISCYLLYPILDKFIKPFCTKNMLYFCLLWLAGTTLCTFYSKFSLFDCNMIYLNVGFAVLGYYLSKFNMGKFKNISVYVYLLSVICAFFATCFLTMKRGYLDELMFRSNATNIVLMTVCVFVVFKEFDFKIKNEIFFKIRNFISSHTYGIFFIHEIYVCKFSKMLSHAEICAAVSVPLNFIVTLIFSALSIYLLLVITDKIPYLNKINRMLIG